MNKQFVRARPLLSEDVFRDLCVFSRQKDRMLDEQQLCRLVQRAVDRSWLLCRAIEKDAYSRLIRALGKQRAAAVAVAAAQDGLRTALNDSQEHPEERAERFARAHRKLQLMGAHVEKVVSQLVRDFKEIEFLEPPV